MILNFQLKSELKLEGCLCTQIFLFQGSWMLKPS